MRLLAVLFAIMTAALACGAQPAKMVTPLSGFSFTTGTGWRMTDPYYCNMGNTLTYRGGLVVDVNNHCVAGGGNSREGPRTYQTGVSEEVAQQLASILSSVDFETLAELYTEDPNGDYQDNESFPLVFFAADGRTKNSRMTFLSCSDFAGGIKVLCVAIRDRLMHG